jgi:hypothetical protein
MGRMKNRSGFEVKCSAVRAHLVLVEKRGLLASVLQKVPEETRQALVALPLPGAWIDGQVQQDLLAAVDALHGTTVTRAILHEAQTTVTAPRLMPIISGLLRLFGASPDTLLSRFGELTKTQLRGPQFQWTRDSPNSGRLTVTMPKPAIHPRCAFLGFESGCLGVLEVCGARGSVAPAQISDDGMRGTIAVRWE